MERTYSRYAQLNRINGEWRRSKLKHFTLRWHQISEKVFKKEKKILRVRDTSLHQPREKVRAEVSLTVTVTLFLGGWGPLSGGVNVV